MRRRPCQLLFPIFVCLAVLSGAMSQTRNSNQQNKLTKPVVSRSSAKPQARKARPSTPRSGPDLARERTLYVVGYAHLDTQWRWEYPQVIQEYLPKTMRNNFALFEKYPNYIFNFTGAYRYSLMKDYYPADFERLKQYVAAGRWFPAGSSMDEGDVNSPNAESIIRQIL